MAHWQLLIAADAKFNPYRASSVPGFKRLYLRRRSQLLQQSNLSEEAGRGISNYLQLRLSLLQQRYKVSLDQLSQRSGWSSSIRSGSRLTMEGGDLGLGSPTPFKIQGQGPEKTSTKGQVVPTHCAEASRAIVGGTSIAENYAFSGVHHIFDQHKDSVSMVKFGHNDATVLCCSSLDGNLTLCKLDEESPRVLLTLQRHTAGVTGFDWSSSNDLIVSCGMDGQLCLWDASSGKCLRTVPDQSNSQILSCIFHPLNSNWIVAGNSVGLVQVLNISTGRYPPGGTSQTADAVTALTFDAAGGILWAGNAQGTITSFRFDLSSGKLCKARRTLVPGNGAITCLSARTWANREARDPSLLVSSASSSLLIYRIIDDDGGLKLKRTFTIPHQSQAIHSAFSPIISFHQGSCIVSGSEDGKVWILDAEKDMRPILNKLQGHCAPVLSVSFSYNEDFLASSDASGLIIIWNRQKELR